MELAARPRASRPQAFLGDPPPPEAPCQLGRKWGCGRCGRTVGTVADVRSDDGGGDARHRSDGFTKDDFGVADMWEGTVKKFANRTSIVFEGQSYTYKQVDERTFATLRTPGSDQGPNC